jgi:hypothetical protein
MMQDTTLTPNPTVDSNDELSKNQTSEDSLLRTFDTTTTHSTHYTQSTAHPSMAMTNKNKTPLLLVLSLVAILAGVGTGYGGFKLQTKATSGGPTGGGEIQQVAEGSVKAGDIFGVNDESTFKDNAQGYLEIGGLDGEGSHKLLRPGGESQTVYLTSSITDLDKFDGMEVKVWGETFKGQKAGWLMDVGRVEIVNVKGSAPTED